jgi:hypothetical protein
LGDIFFRKSEGRSGGEKDEKEDSDDHRARWVELRRLHWSDSNRDAFAGPVPRPRMIVFRLPDNELRVVDQIDDLETFPVAGISPSHFRNAAREVMRSDAWPRPFIRRYRFPGRGDVPVADSRVVRQSARSDRAVLARGCGRSPFIIFQFGSTTC